jgi:hypothetical protein
MENAEEKEKLEAFYRELDQMTIKINDPSINLREFVFFDGGTPYVIKHVDKIMTAYKKHFSS